MPATLRRAAALAYDWRAARAPLLHVNYIRRDRFSPAPRRGGRAPILKETDFIGRPRRSPKLTTMGVAHAGDDKMPRSHDYFGAAATHYRHISQ